jgi:hypothetical protein
MKTKVVKINGKNMSEQFTYTLGNTIVEGGPNLPMCDKNIRVKTTLYLEPNRKKKLSKNHDELYHLLTDAVILDPDGLIHEKFYHQSLDDFPLRQEDHDNKSNHLL